MATTTARLVTADGTPCGQAYESAFHAVPTQGTEACRAAAGNA
ncbi:hypothetical protein ACQPZG_04285 (plasmid) [Streptomyces sp. CA-294286]